MDKKRKRLSGNQDIRMENSRKAGYQEKSDIHQPDVPIS